MAHAKQKDVLLEQSCFLVKYQLCHHCGNWQETCTQAEGHRCIHWVHSFLRQNMQTWESRKDRKSLWKGINYSIHWVVNETEYYMHRAEYPASLAAERHGAKAVIEELSQHADLVGLN